MTQSICNMRKSLFIGSNDIKFRSFIGMEVFINGSSEHRILEFNLKSCFLSWNDGLSYPSFFISKNG